MEKRCAMELRLYLIELRGELQIEELTEECYIDNIITACLKI
jgi:hypothetical protein